MHKELQRQSSLDAQAEKEPDHKYHAQEMQLEQKFDTYVNNIARANKIETIPWLKLTEFLVWVFLILTLF